MSSKLPRVASTDQDTLFQEKQRRIFCYDFDGAVEVLQRAHKVDPTNDKILVDLGGACAKAYDFASAERYFDMGVNVSTQKALAMNAVATHWMEVRQYETAQKWLEQIVSAGQVPIATFIRLGEIYIRTRKLDKATELAHRALLVFGPKEGAAWLFLAKIFRHKGELGEAERLLRTIIASANFGLDFKAGASYELGTVLDQIGNYDQAWSAFVDAKALMGQNLGKDPVAANARKFLQQKQATLRELSQNISADLAQRWRKAGKSELQPERKMALLCGHARSGTTLLEYVLDSHPGIVSADETMVFHNKAYYPIGCANAKNTSFLKTLDWMSSRNIRQIREGYFRGIESFLGQPVGERMLVDKNPANTFDIPAILRVFPENRFLVALRDPRDVCLSCFMQPVPVIPDTASWLTLEGTIDHYAHIMNLWLAWKPHIGEMAMEVRYEDLIDDLEKTSRRALEFLGLPWDERVMKFNEHVQKKVVRSPTFAEVVRPIYRGALGRWNKYRKHFEPHLKKFEPFLKIWGYE